jgi:hypothetical protein
VSEDRSYWFAAKTYGIGWSLPVTWQGWVTVLVFFGLLFGGFAVIESPRSQLVYGGVLGVLLIAVIVWKGEKPMKWRWGRKRAD